MSRRRHALRPFPLMQFQWQLAARKWNTWTTGAARLSRLLSSQRFSCGRNNSRQHLQRRCSQQTRSLSSDCAVSSEVCFSHFSVFSYRPGLLEIVFPFVTSYTWTFSRCVTAVTRYMKSRTIVDLRRTKGKGSLICIALSYELLTLKRSVSLRHVLTRDNTVLPATHTFIHKWNEPLLRRKKNVYRTARIFCR